MNRKLVASSIRRASNGIQRFHITKVLKRIMCVIGHIIQLLKIVVLIIF